MKNFRVLISGGLGFIGLELARQLVKRGDQVLLFDNLSAQVHGAIPDMAARPLLRDAGVQVLRGDVAKASDWKAALAEVDAVIHLAAETGTAQSMYEISRYTETNVGGTAALLHHLAHHRHQVRKIVLASSRSVYGEGAYRCQDCGMVYPPARSAASLRAGEWQPRCPQCGNRVEAAATPEAAKPAPASIYAATKLAQEDLVRVGGLALGIPAVIFRFQNVYGEGQSLRNPYTGILSIFSNQLRLGKRVHLYEDGQETRDFVHVSDVAEAVGLALVSDGADGSTLNLGSGQPTSIESVALLLGERLGAKTPPLVSGEYRLGDIRHGYADISAIRRCLPFTPRISLEEGLSRFTEWVRTQPLAADRLAEASAELQAHGLMARAVAADDLSGVSVDGGIDTDIDIETSDGKNPHVQHAHAKTASL